MNPWTSSSLKSLALWYDERMTSTFLLASPNCVSMATLRSPDRYELWCLRRGPSTFSTE